MLSPNSHTLSPSLSAAESGSVALLLEQGVDIRVPTRGSERRVTSHLIYGGWMSVQWQTPWGRGCHPFTEMRRVEYRFVPEGFTGQGYFSLSPCCTILWVEGYYYVCDIHPQAFMVKNLLLCWATFLLVLWLFLGAIYLTFCFTEGFPSIQNEMFRRQRRTKKTSKCGNNYDVIP